MIAASFTHDWLNPEAWAWTALCIAAFALTVATRTTGRGVLWRPVDRWLRRRLRDEVDRIIATAQLRVPLILAAWPLPTQQLRELIGAGLFVALFLDDWLAGEDGDQWKRRRKAARSAIRWLMELPRAPREAAHG